MKKLIIISICIAVGISLASIEPAHAADGCYADYKAKSKSKIKGQMKLHYGVIQLPDSACGNSKAAKKMVSARIGRDGWSVLKVVSTFDKSGLNKRRSNAGSFFLRY